MGFFADGDLGVSAKAKRGQPSSRLLNEMGCRACPLNKAQVNTPKMKPSGPSQANILVLGAMPSAKDDKSGRHLSDTGGQLFKKHVPEQYFDGIAYDYVIRDHAKDVDTVAVECCRPLITKQIEQCRPKVVFGLGEEPLNWVTGQNRISNWRGRRMPAKVGKHTFWFFPVEDPHRLVLIREFSYNGFTEDERMFTIDMRKAFERIKKLPPPVVHSREDVFRGVEIVKETTHKDAIKIRDYLRWAAKQPDAGVDFECNKLRPYYADAKLLTVAVAAGSRSLAFPVEHKDAKWSAEDFEMIVGALLDFFMAPNVRKSVHNLAFELEWIAVLYGRQFVRGSRWDCSMSQAYVLDQRKGKGEDDQGALECFALGFLTTLYFGIDIKKLSTVNRKDMASESLENILPYNAVDAKYHRLVMLAQDRELADEQLTHVYERHLSRIPTVTLTQVKGIPIDQDMSQDLWLDYGETIKEIEAEIASSDLAKKFLQRTGRRLVPSSNPDLLELCRTVLNKPVASVDETRLKGINDPTLNKVLDLRFWSKLKSTYVWPRGSHIVYPDGCAHPILNTVKTRTSRLSSEDFNEQNLPKRDEVAKEVRRQIRAIVNYILLSLDYAQIEARVFAMASRDKLYTQAWWEDYDIHMDWAIRLAHAYPARIGGKKFMQDKDVMKKWRNTVKNSWVFALLFGAKSFSNMETWLEIPENYLKPLFDVFWKEFHGLRDWQEKTQKFYAKNGYVELLTGRRRYGPLSFNQVINTPIQGTMAEITLDGMNRISELDIWDAQPIMQVHDDLTFMVPENENEFGELLETIVREMVKPAFDFINVPIVAEGAVGFNLCDMSEFAKFKSTDYWPMRMHGR